MGGHAFKELNCPRMAPDVYQRIKSHVTSALQTMFSYVVVPTEMPEKADFGDVDFLVSPASSTSIDIFDWSGTVNDIKALLGTTHGRRGFLTPDCMYFAIAAAAGDKDFWVQIDVKVCFKPELFAWCAFEHNYASNSKIIGSMVKPLGLTLDPEGFHIRVEEIEDTNFPGSMTWISKDPKDLLRIAGLDRRLLDADFKSKAEIYEVFTGSWLFNAAHFKARLGDDKHSNRLEDRAAYWTHFLKEWLPKRYPDCHDSARDREDLQTWYKHTRAAVRCKVFTMFPDIAEQYYVKRAAHIKEVEEHRLRNIITEAIPVGIDGWEDDFPQPLIFLKHRELPNPLLQPAVVEELTPPLTPTSSIEAAFRGSVNQAEFGNRFTPPLSPCVSGLDTRTSDVPLYIDRLDRDPPLTCRPRPPPANMSPEAKLLCLARWTRFDPDTGRPYLISEPHPKDFNMHWAEAVHAGATDVILVKWAKTMWWPIWVRQSHVNFIGMWKKRFEKEDRKEAKRVDEEKAAEAAREKISERLRRLKMTL